MRVVSVDGRQVRDGGQQLVQGGASSNRIPDVRPDPTGSAESWQSFATRSERSFIDATLTCAADGDSRVCVFEHNGTQVAALDPMPERKKKAISSSPSQDDRIPVEHKHADMLVFDHQRELQRRGRLKPSAIGSQPTAGEGSRARTSWFGAAPTDRAVAGRRNRSSTNSSPR